MAVLVTSSELCASNNPALSSAIEMFVNEIPSPSISTDNQLIYCYGEIIETTFIVDIEGDSYQWLLDGEEIQNAFESSYTATQQGSYSVVVTKNNCTGVSNELSIVESTIISYSLMLVETENPSGAGNGVIILSAQGGTGTLTYSLWETNLGEITINQLGIFDNLINGDYWIVVTDENGCSVTTDIIQLESLSITISTLSVSCFGANDGSIEVSISGGTPPYSITWNGPNGPLPEYNDILIITDLSHGEYNVTVQDLNGNFINEGATITQPGEIIISVNLTQPSCFGNEDASITVEVEGGIPPYFSRINGSDWQAASQFFNLASGLHIIEVVDANGCFSLLEIEVIDVEQIEVVGIDFSNPTCDIPGAISVVAIGGTQTLTYTLMPNDISNSTGVFENLGGGIYEIFVTDANNCGPISSGTIILESPSTILIDEISVSHVISCNEDFLYLGEIEVFASGGNGTLQYSINGGETFQNNGLFTDLLPDEYQLIVTDGLCPVFEIVTINDLPIPSPIISTLDLLTYCEDDAIEVVLSADISDAESYQWLLDGEPIDDAISENYTANQQGIYSIMVNQMGCSTISNEIEIVVQPNPEVSISTGVIYLTLGASHLFDAGQGFATYQWHDGSSEQTYLFESSVFGLGSFEVWVEVATEFGCSTVAYATVVVSESIQPIISTLDPLSYCEGQPISVTFEVNITDADSYQWMLDGETIEGATENTYVASEAGSYSVFITKDDDSGTSNILIVSVIPLPEPIISTENALTFCAGDEIIVEFTVNITDAESYQWMLNGEVIEGAIENTFTATSVGIISVEVTLGGCSGLSDGVAISLFPAISPTISTSDNLIWNEDDDVMVSLAVVPDNADAYQWLHNGEEIAEATDNTYTATSAGLYSVAVTIGICTEISNSIEVIVNPAGTLYPVISTEDNLSWCEGEEISVLLSVDIDDADTYQWLLNGAEIPDANESTYLATAAGAYSVYITKGDGAGTSNVLTISTIPTPEPFIIATGFLTYCEGDEINVELMVDIESAEEYQWFVNGNPIDDANQPVYTVQEEGVYWVQVTVNGCSGVSNLIDIVVFNNPVPTISTSDPLTWCEGAEISVTFDVDIIDEEALYQWYLNGEPIENAVESTYTANTVGTYHIMVTINGCSGISNSFAIILDDMLYPIISTTDQTQFCEGDEVLVTLLVNITNADTYQWYNGDVLIEGENSSTITVTEVGVYWVIVTQGTCTGESNQIEVIVNPLPVPEIFTEIEPSDFCEGQEVYLPLEVSIADAEAYQWFLNGVSIEGATDNTFIATDEGGYTVEVVVNGCTGISGIFTVSIIPNPLPFISTIDPLSWCSNDEIEVTFETNIFNPNDLDVSYQWFINGSAIVDATNSSITAIQAGVYSVEVTLSYLCTWVSNEVAITVSPTPEPIISTEDPLSYCEGEEFVVLLEVDIAEADEYIWLHNGDVIEGATSSSYSATEAGSYSVMVYLNGCPGLSNPIQITLTSNPAPLIYTLDQLSWCIDTEISVTFETTFIDTEAIYQWFLNGEAIADANSSTYTATEVGIYWLMVTFNGCSGISNSFEILQDDVLHPIAFTPDMLVWCSSQEVSVTLYTDISNADSYQWYVNDQPIDGADTESYIATEGGIYWVEVYQGACSGVSNLVEVIVVPSPTPIIFTNDQISWCNDSEILVEFFVDINNADFYQWFFNGEPIEGANESTYTTSLVGEYSILVIVEGCEGVSNIIEIVQDDVLYPIITADGPTQLCEGDIVNITFTVNIPNADSYQWYNGEELIDGEESASLTVTEIGTYWVLLSQGICQGVSNEVVVAINPVPVVSLATDTIRISVEETYLFDAGEGFSSYLWNDGSTNQGYLFQGSVHGIGTHEVWVEVTNEFGCSARDTAIVIVGPTRVELLYPWTVNLYPNPSTGEFYLSVEGINSRKVAITVLNTTGQLVYRKELRPTESILHEPINLSGKGKGVYIISINDGKRIITRRIVIE